MLALHLLQRISHGIQEILVGRQDRAIQLKLDDGLGLADRSHLSAIIGILQLPSGDVDGVLDDFERAPFSSRIGLYEPWIQTSRPPLPTRRYSPSLILAAAELVPKLLVLCALSIGIIDEHAVMLPLDLVQRVSHRLQEVLVGGHDRAVELKLDDGLRIVDGSELPAQVRQDSSRIRLS